MSSLNPRAAALLRQHAPADMLRDHYFAELHDRETALECESCGCYQERDTGAWIPCPRHEDR